MPKSPSLIGIVLIAVLLTLSACTRVVTVRVPATDLSSGSAAITEAEAADAWWSIAFRMHWDPEQTPDWYLDALLADQVYAPALSDAGSAIRLWRFHRRAADDEAGHRLSLLTYTNKLKRCPASSLAARRWKRHKLIGGSNSARAWAQT